MMRPIRLVAPLSLVLLSLLHTGCDGVPPGMPKESERWKSPQEITDFTKIYAQNCLACHSDGTTVSAARSMNDPVYLAIVGPDNLQKIIADGVPNTAMPGFSIPAGGELTTEQIAILVKGIMAWKDPAKVPSGPLPPYAAPLGDATRGAAAFATYCASCHGVDGRGVPSKGGSIVDPSFLALVSDQALRTTVITGRPDFGTPDWRGYVPGHPMSDQEISDVVAWLSSQRKAVPGRVPTVTEPVTGASLPAARGVDPALSAQNQPQPIRP